MNFTGITCRWLRYAFLCNEMIRAVITDDHPIVANGLQTMLQKTGTIQVLAKYNSAKELLENIKSLQPNILILDMQLPDGDGFDIATKVLQACPGTQILVFSSSDTVYHVKKMLQAGCGGYALKNTDDLTLVKAIETVAAGGRFLSPELEAALVEDMFRNKGKTTKTATLTKREKEVLELIVQEHTNQEIANKLFLGLSTVELHRTNMLQKLGVKNTAGLVRVAVQTGLV